MSPIVSLIIDVILVGLLGATIVYAIRLNKQIVELRDSRTEMAELIRGLNEATAKADAGVKGMKKAAMDTGEDLQKAIDKAAGLRDEMKFMIETGEALADRLGSISSSDKGRAAVRIAAKPPLEDSFPLPPRSEPRREAPMGNTEEPPRSREGQEGMSRAERELMQAIENRR